MIETLATAVVWLFVFAVVFIVMYYHENPGYYDGETTSNKTSESDEYDGPRLGEPVKFAMLVGPEDGVGVLPMENGGVYITPQTAYQRRNGEWVDLEVDTEPVFRSVATYVDPQAIRQQQQQDRYE